MSPPTTPTRLPFVRDPVDFAFAGFSFRGRVLEYYGGTAPAFALVQVSAYLHPFTVPVGDLRPAAGPVA